VVPSTQDELLAGSSWSAISIAVRGSTDGSQSARFGSKGEDFVLARRLQ
jgi:hypothetical protein